nr:hypothetical protein [Tanacetum cinerariifolium]
MGIAVNDVYVQQAANKIGCDILNHIQKKIGNGKDTFFGDDVWLGDILLKYSFPRIYNLEVNKQIDVASKMTQMVLGFRWPGGILSRLGEEGD